MALALLLGGILWVAAARLLPPGGPQDRPVSRPWPAQAPPVRVVAFGTSLTAGNDWPDRLGARLSACFGTGVSVTRVAGPGMGSAWALDNLAPVIAAAPEAVLIEFAINDADILDGVGLARARRQHDLLLGALRAALPETRLILMTMSPAQGLRRALRPRLPAYYASYRDLAATHDTGLVDLFPRWQQAAPEIRNFADGLHPADAQVAAVLLDPVMNAFAAATSRDCAPGPTP